MPLPYLPPPLRDEFDAWLDATLARHMPPLTFTELRKGVQAVSSLYVERRGEGGLATRAIEGTGKRAALATYYAALHFLTVHHALRMVEHPALSAASRVVDLGCGTGAAGAAAARTLGPMREILGVDRSGWALEEAARTWLSFGIAGRAQRAELVEAVPRGAAGTLIVCGWSISELGEDDRAGVLRKIVGALRRGAALLVVEPLARGVAPWLGEWTSALRPLHVADELIRVAIDRPGFIRDMDKAAGLDHQVIGARVLFGGRAAHRPAAEGD